VYFCFSCSDVSPSAIWKALVVLIDQFECYLLVEKQDSHCSKHITLEITSCYVLMISSYMELTGQKQKNKKQKRKAEKEESTDNYTAPGKTDSGQHHVE